MLVLTSADVIRVGLSAATAVDALAGYADNAAASFAPGSQATTFAAAGPTTVVSAPAAATTRNVSSLSLRARGGANTLDVEFFNGSAFDIVTAALASGERLEYENGRGWSVYDAAGAFKQSIAAAAGSIALTSLAAQAANTIVANATGGAASPTAVALGAQSVLIQAAANLVAVAAAAGQVLGRTAAGGNLGFIPVPGGLLRAPQIVTATNAAFAHPAGTQMLVVEGVGGGGGGGGCAATLGAMGNGGNAANWGKKTFTSISGTSNITIGAAGTGASAAAGNNGGNSSFVHNAVTFTLPGGIGGTITAGAATVTIGTANAGNAASTGADIGIVGQVGARAVRSTAAAGVAVSGDGGCNPMGEGGFSLSATASAGNAASGFGAGGGGAVAATVATAAAGGNGTPGAFIIYEYG